MLWSQVKQYHEKPFGLESELESAIEQCQSLLFGPSRYYLPVKKKIGTHGGIQGIPDAYLLDLSSTKRPDLFVFEIDLASHDPLKHIAVQILSFSLAFEQTPQKVKEIVRKVLATSPAALSAATSYAMAHDYENVDRLLESIIYREDGFNALVLIDELSEDLERILATRFQFPVELLTLERFEAADGSILYRFEPFLSELAPAPTFQTTVPVQPTVDPSEIDTLVVPAHEDGFNEVFLGENRWWSVRIHSSMIPRIKHIAAYRVAPISAITHLADVAKIEAWKDSPKYVLTFRGPPREIGPLKLRQGGSVRPLQGPRYTSYERIMGASSLEDAF